MIARLSLYRGFAPVGSIEAMHQAPRKITERDFNKRLGRRLKALRLNRLMTVDEAVSDTPITAEKLKRYESGYSGISVFHLLQLLNALDMPAARFFNDGPQDSISVDGLPAPEVRTLRALVRRMRQGAPE